MMQQHLLLKRIQLILVKLTINQDMPIHSLAYITVMIDTRDMTVSVYELVENIKKIQKVKDVTLVAFE